MSRAIRRPATGPVVDVIIDSPRWKKHPAAARRVRRAVRSAAPAKVGKAELAVMLTDDKSIRALNLQWRGKDTATNVLSFPAAPPRRRSAPRPLGDIVIAYETTAAESRAEGKRFDHHLAHLVVHGFLHLLGYDHESDREAEDMERRERSILARLDVPDPYAARDARA
jgi:probable rRNA maturation factor